MSIQLGCGRVRQCVVLFSAALLLGCNYNKQTAGIQNAYDAGDFTRAAEEATAQAEKTDKRDKVILRLEEGAITRAAGQFQNSDRAFERADNIVSDYDRQPDLQVSQELLAASINQTAMDYRGYEYDRIMMNTYMALNAMQEGNFDAARVQLTRAYNRQQEAVEKYAKKIEADDKVKKEKQKDYDVDRAMSDEKFQSQLSTNYSDLEGDDLSAYKNYVNPFTEYLRGLFLMSAGVDASDSEQAATAMRRVAGMVHDNPYVQQDMAIADKVANGEAIPPTTYVIFETGLAPQRGEIRIDIPIFLFNAAVHDTRVDYIGASFPKLEKRPCPARQLVVQTSGGTYPTAMLCDMDKVIAQEFKNEMPMVITRTLISTAVKAGAAYGAERATEQNQWANLITRVGTTVYQAGANQADLRTWKSLPKFFCIARVPTPQDRQITLSIQNGGVVGPIILEPGEVNVVYVKTVEPTKTVVRQFKLK